MSVPCRLGLHRWRNEIVLLCEWPILSGITLRKCTRCGTRRRPR